MAMAGHHGFFPLYAFIVQDMISKNFLQSVNATTAIDKIAIMHSNQ
jgi:hypothetical protein